MKIEFVFIAEAGPLEEQSLLLCESIRERGGTCSGYDIKILQPRSEKKISPDIKNRLEALGADIIAFSLVSPCPQYGSSYRVLACAEYEGQSQADILIFLDSDSLILAEPDFDLAGHDVALRPVDVKGICSSGAGDPFDAYWQKLCRLCAVDYSSLPEVTSTVDRVRVKASYNGGLTVVQRRAGLFAKTAEFFQKSIAAGLQPSPDCNQAFPAGHGLVSAEGGKLWGSAQAALSLAITALGLKVRLLPPSQNFPLHSYSELEADIAAGTFPILSHVHYHHLLSLSPALNPILAGKPGFPGGASQWLRRKLNRGKKLVLVLGMHRSGTSLFTKGLESLGVDLGSNFNPPTDDNPTGFWEEKDFQSLNEELLSALDRDWDDLQLSEDGSVFPKLEKFLPRALDLLDAFLQNKARAGLKDPRFSLLLPFWQEAFAQAGLQTVYLIVFRNPLSVAASLARRDRFGKEKSLRLWALHNVSIIGESGKSPRLFADYDELLAQPRTQLERMARFLGLDPEEKAAAAFSSHFLRADLRHARHGRGELLTDPDASPLLLEIWDFLVGAAQNLSSPEGKEESIRWKKILQSPDSLSRLPALLSRDLKTLRSDFKDRHLALWNRLQEREAVLAALSQSHEDLGKGHRKLLQTHQDQQAEKEKLLVSQKELLRHREELLRNQDEMARQRDGLDRKIAELFQRIGELDHQAGELSFQNGQLKHQHSVLEGRIKSMQSSFSWKITLPLRILARWWAKIHQDPPPPS